MNVTGQTSLADLIEQLPEKHPARVEYEWLMHKDPPPPSLVEAELDAAHDDITDLRLDVRGLEAQVNQARAEQAQHKIAGPVILRHVAQARAILRSPFILNPHDGSDLCRCRVCMADRVLTFAHAMILADYDLKEVVQ